MYAPARLHQWWWSLSGLAQAVAAQKLRRRSANEECTIEWASVLRESRGDLLPLRDYSPAPVRVAMSGEWHRRSRVQRWEESALGVCLIQSFVRVCNHVHDRAIQEVGKVGGANLVAGAVQLSAGKLAEIDGVTGKGLGLADDGHPRRLHQREGRGAQTL